MRKSSVVALIFVLVLLTSSVSALWPFEKNEIVTTGFVAEGDSRPTIISTSPSEDTIHVGAHQLISLSFTAEDPDGDMDHMWMQLWRAQSTSNPDDFMTPASGYNNPSGFYTGAQQDVTQATSSTFTFSLGTAGTYYIRFAVRDVASGTLTESWKTIIVGERGASCGADNQCQSGLECRNAICNNPVGSTDSDVGSTVPTEIANVCQECNATTQCTPGTFCEMFYYDRGICKYNAGKTGESCQQSPSVSTSKCAAGTYIKPCMAGLTCSVNQAWDTTFGFLGTPGVCQNLSVGLNQACDANNICITGLVCSADKKCAVPTQPTITKFEVANPSVATGTPLTVSIIAMQGTFPIKHHRLYVVGSQGGTWTTLATPQATVTLDTTILTVQHPNRFYLGPGQYTLRYEIEDTEGKRISLDKAVSILSTSPGSGSGTSNPPSSGASTTPTNIAPAQGTKDFSEYCSSTSECKVGLVCDTISSTCLRPTNGPCENSQQCSVISICEKSIGWPYSVCRKKLNAVCNIATPSECRSGLVCRVNSANTLMCSLPTSSQQPTNILPGEIFPTIQYLEINPTQAIQGQNIVVNAHATAFPGTVLRKHRLCVLNASSMSACEWMNTAQVATSVSMVNVQISTVSNSRSFYHGIGDYIIRYEVQDSTLKVASTDRLVTVLASSSLATSNRAASTSAATSAGTGINTGANIGQGTGQSGSGSSSSPSGNTESSVSTSQCPNGCLSSDLRMCYSAGHRREGAYCDAETRTFLQQLDAEAACNNNFECSSNLCLDSKCVSRNFLQQFIEFLKQAIK